MEFFFKIKGPIPFGRFWL
jgi:hypothetical protein